jgi:hypothetical protein
VGPRATDEGKPAADVAWESRRVEDEAIEEALRAEEEARAIREGGGGRTAAAELLGTAPGGLLRAGCRWTRTSLTALSRNWLSPTQPCWRGMGMTSLRRRTLRARLHAGLRRNARQS